MNKKLLYMGFGLGCIALSYTLLIKNCFVAALVLQGIEDVAEYKAYCRYFISFAWVAWLIAVWTYKRTYRESKLVNVEVTAVGGYITVLYVLGICVFNFIYFKSTLKALWVAPYVSVLEPVSSTVNSIVLIIYVAYMHYFAKEVKGLEERKIVYMDRNHYYNALNEQMKVLLDLCKDAKIKKALLEFKESIDYTYDTRNTNRNDDVLFHLRNAEILMEDDKSVEEIQEEIKQAKKQWDMN